MKLAFVRSLVAAPLLLMAVSCLQVTCFQPQLSTSKLHSLQNPNAFTTPRDVFSLAQNQKLSPSSSQPTTTTTTTTRLWESTTNASNEEGDGELDVDAIVKYGAALVIQMGMFSGLFFGLDKAVAAVGLQVPFAINFVLFYFCALKSRVFNPLSNSRPNQDTKEIQEQEQNQRKMPTWTPPGVVFPIVWLLLIGPLRAYTSAMIYSASGGYFNEALLSLMLHLSIGDVWNTINNVERRYGTSVLGIVCVYLSAAFAAYQYYQVLPIAGQLLSLKLIWLTIASSLIIRTWQLNPKEDGNLYSILPRKEGDSKTEFLWF